jgi:hypothetical protein
VKGSYAFAILEGNFEYYIVLPLTVLTKMSQRQMGLPKVSQTGLCFSSFLISDDFP